MFVVIAIWFMAEIGTTEKSAVALIVHCAHNRNVRYYARRFALSDLFSVGITCVRNHVETIGLQFSLCSLSHRPEATDIRRIEYHSMCHNQSLFGIDSSLDVVCRKCCLTHQHVASFCTPKKITVQYG